MGGVVSFPKRLTLDEAWQRYCELARRYKAGDPEDRELANDLLRAWKVYADLFNQAEASK